MTFSELLDFWEDLNSKESLRLFLLLNQDQRSDLMMEMTGREQEQLLSALSTQASKNLLNVMDPDDLVSLIREVSPEIRNSVWENLNSDQREETRFLLRFDEDAAAGLMTPRYGALRAESTIGQAIQFLRNDVAQDLETIYYLYVVDDLKRLIGVISLREILAAKDKQLVGGIMEEHVIYVHEDTDQEEVAQVLEENDLLALPVVDSHHKLLGIITFDDIIDVIREEQTEDIYRMGALGGEAGNYLDYSVMGLVWKRLPWLVLLLIAGTVTTNLLDNYTNLTMQALFLTLFIPVITQTGGNSGTQASTLMIRGLATGDLKFRDIGKVLLKELMVGILIGAITGLVIFLRSAYLPPGIETMQAVTVGLSLTAVVFFATILGTLTPMIIHGLGFDPTVAAGPLMSTVIDVCGLTIYFEIARRILNL
jgi:magnesium transporter